MVFGARGALLKVVAELPAQKDPTMPLFIGIADQLCIAAIAISILPALALAQADKPNVVVMVVDNLGWGTGKGCPLGHCPGPL